MLGTIFQWISRLLSLRKPSNGQDTSSEPSPSLPSLSDKNDYTSKQGKISRWFTYKEATHSNTAAARGIDNTPSDKELEAILSTAKYLDSVREYLGHPILVNSWYRNPTVNKAVGGSGTSDHMSGKSVDFRCPAFGSPYNVCKALIVSGIPFDQLIFETNSRGSQWVHIGFGDRMRGEVLTYTPSTGYRRGLWEP